MLIAFLLCGAIAFAQNNPAGTSLLKYKLIEKFGTPFFCDKDKWPVGRPEEPRAKEWFAQVDLTGEEFKAMCAHLNLNKPADHMEETDILALYREHKTLSAITVEGNGNVLKFAIRTGIVGQQGESITGTISAGGEIEIQNRETMWNMCPKCLSRGSMIDTPEGEIPVEDMKIGMPVWTINEAGVRIAATVQQVISVPVPPNHQVVRIKLENGRVLVASPEHPLANGQTIGELRPGELVNGMKILHTELVPYTDEYTYDVLPSGPTGSYWANGVLLNSTLSR